MLTLRRLNMDSSWALSWAGTTILIDPWLIGSEVDGFSWFNEQWHVTSPVLVDSIGEYQAILISQAYSDHCHQQTLKELQTVPFFATPSASRRLKREMRGREINILPELTSGKWLDQGVLQLAYLNLGRMLDPIYNGIVIRHKDEVVVYFPHGFTLSTNQMKALQAYKTLLLITSFSSFKLPVFLGGVSNPGAANALSLVEALNPRKVVHTHDENKHAKGLVTKLAKVAYPDPLQLEASMGGRFVYVQYEPFTVS